MGHGAGVGLVPLCPEIQAVTHFPVSEYKLGENGTHVKWNTAKRMAARSSRPPMTPKKMPRAGPVLEDAPAAEVVVATVVVAGGVGFAVGFVVGLGCFGA